jgi:hypothetical protein
LRLNQIGNREERERGLEETKRGVLEARGFAPASKNLENRHRRRTEDLSNKIEFRVTGSGGRRLITGPFSKVLGQEVDQILCSIVICIKEFENHHTAVL